MINSYKRLVEAGFISALVRAGGKTFKRVRRGISRLRPEPNTPPEDTPARPGATPDPDAPKGQAHISNRSDTQPQAWSQEKRDFMRSLGSRR